MENEGRKPKEGKEKTEVGVKNEEASWLLMQFINDAPCLYLFGVGPGSKGMCASVFLDWLPRRCLKYLNCSDIYI